MGVFAEPDPLAVAREQLPLQAATFAAAPAMRHEEALQLLLRCTAVGPEDTLLEVGCGPGDVKPALAGWDGLSAAVSG